MTVISDLFDPEPQAWGLRGDPLLWREMKESFSQTSLPQNGLDFRAEIERVFLELVGVPLSDKREMHYVDRYASGGMSSGHVSLKFWTERACSMLDLRFANARRQE
jgi:hypothetical protein